MAEYIVGLSDEMDAYDIDSFMREFAVNGQIVRCKDCKWAREKRIMGKVVCVDNTVRDPDWFCADGERRDDNA